MGRQIMKFVYASALTDLCEINSSFDKAVLQIAYTGKNRNGTYISKETFEKCLKTIYNCPIVCNYDRDNNTLGGHDVEIVRNDKDELEFVNVTTPVGCIPESANIFWQNIKDEDGVEREYLCSDALIWKRQEAYKKIKEDGFAAESMEITVIDGEMLEDTYHIYDFEFTAFALIGVEPCFEGASINFNMAAFEEKLSQMKFDLENSFPSVADTSGDINKNSKEGGSADLKKNFELESNIRKGLCSAIESVTVSDEGGETYPKYWLMDYDTDAKIAYVEDIEGGETYSVPFSIDDGVVSVDFDSITQVRLTWSPVDGSVEESTEEESAEPEEEFSEQKDPDEDEDDTEDNTQDNNEDEEPGEEEDTESDNEEEESPEEDDDEDEDIKSKYEEVVQQLETVKAKLKELSDYKLINELSFVFEEFGDLSNIEEFKIFREKFVNGKSGIDNEADLREACFAIRGRNCGARFAYENKNPRLRIQPTGMDNSEPYGGLIEKYSSK